MVAMAAPLARADPNMVPDYEVKLLMIPTAVLGSDNKLKATVLSTFSMPTSGERSSSRLMNVMLKQT
jgi:hypothetical protein